MIFYYNDVLKKFFITIIVVILFSGFFFAGKKYLKVQSNGISEDTHHSIATFSIVARDSITGEIGIAVASRFFAVGTVVPWAKAGVGAVATQSFANTTFGWRGLELLERGITPEEAKNIFNKKIR